MYMKQDWIVNNNLKNKLPMGNTCEGTPGSAASHWWWASDACRQGHYPRNGRAGHPVRFFLGSTNRQKTHKGNALYNSSPLNQANAPQPHASPCSGLRSFWPFPFPSRSSCPPGSRRALKRQPRTTLRLTEIHHYQTSPYLGLSCPGHIWFQNNFSFKIERSSHWYSYCENVEKKLYRIWFLGGLAF